MMQAAYDERQKITDYIDYQRTNHIRGTSDWISGGTVYQSRPPGNEEHGHRRLLRGPAL
jgi:hypothetical protein